MGVFIAYGKSYVDLGVHHGTPMTEEIPI